MNGGTIIFRFRTAQSDALIFGAGTNETLSDDDKDTMLFGVNTDKGVKKFRGVFRTSVKGLYAGFTPASEWNTEQWHTAAISFDTTKADYQNQILISIDGSDNLFTTTSWWKDGWQSWFNVNQQNVINHFAIGGGVYASEDTVNGRSKMPAFEGKISFVTVTGKPYTAEELKVLSQTPSDVDVVELVAELQYKLDEYKTLIDSDGSDYTEETWTRFEEAYRAVETALEEGNKDKTQLTDLLEELNAAKDGLVSNNPGSVTDPELDALITALEGKLNEYKSIYDGNGSEYDAAKWQAFRTAYKNVKDALDRGETNKTTLEGLQTALNQAYSALTPVTPVDPDVADLIEKIQEKLDEYREVYEGSADGYALSKWIRFENAYLAAEEALDENETDKEYLEELLDELKNAYTSLKKNDPEIPEDPEVEALQKDLQKKLDEYKEIFNQTGGNYTAETWNRFHTAYLAVQNALENNEQEKDKLNELLKELNDAKANLKEDVPIPPTVDKNLEAAKKALNNLLTSYKTRYTRDKAKYTDASWKVFAAAYINAQNALKKGTANAATLTSLKNQLENAYKKLVLKPSGKKALTAPAITSVTFAVEKKKLGVKITVQKVANAASYKVYRIVGGTVTEIGNTDAAGVIYDENPVSKKQMSYYAVANPSSASYTVSAKGTAKSITLAASVKKIKVKSAKKKAVLSWKKVKAAKQYIIYRSAQKDSGYVKVKSLKKNKLSYTDKKVKKGKTYYYRIVVKTKKGYTGITTSKSVKIKK